MSQFHLKDQFESSDEENNKLEKSPLMFNREHVMKRGFAVLWVFRGSEYPWADSMVKKILVNRSAVTREEMIKLMNIVTFVEHMFNVYKNKK
jgi:hypothetical protein